MPKIDSGGWTAHEGSVNPIFGEANGPYSEKILGDRAGLTQFRVHLERLPPGSRSSYRHWHETEDEFIYIISGHLVLIEDTETHLQAGDTAGWKAGEPIGHCLENRSDDDAVVLVVGTRANQGVVHYPDYKVLLKLDEGVASYFRYDGTPIT